MNELLAVQDNRALIFESPLALVENLQRQNGRATTTPEAFSADFQVCLPYRGLFVWHVGRDDVVGDANQVLFVSGGESYRLSEPLPDGYAELIVTPALDLLSELADRSSPRLASHPLFRRRRRPADPDLQNRRARFLHYGIGGRWDAVAAEELLVALLRSALEADGPSCDPGGTTRRLIRRTKEYVEAHLSAPLRLGEIAAAVGASPAYLTDVFRRIEGMPLHRYVMQLRLARALVDLPEADDLTALALDLGFSSHSHFTAAFRTAFHCTPSAFRQSIRG